MDNIEIKGLEGTWHAISRCVKGGVEYFLLENNNLDIKTADVIIDENYELIAKNVKTGFRKLDNILRYREEN